MKKKLIKKVVATIYTTVAVLMSTISFVILGTVEFDECRVALILVILLACGIEMIHVKDWLFKD